MNFRILDDATQKRTGAFYTPTLLVDLCWRNIENAIPNYKDYYIWDMSCGTGNLLYKLKNYNKVFMSTLDIEDVNFMKSKNYFPGANIFQYDYLNDDIDLVMNNKDLLDDSLNWKLPRKLREVLKNEPNKVIVFINPPYGEATSGIPTKNSFKENKHKKGINDNTIKYYYQKNKKAMNDLMLQFLFRIFTELPKCKLGLISTQKFLTHDTCKEFKNNYFNIEFLNGLIIHSKVFNLNGNFPITFSLWNLNNKIELNNQNILFKIYDKKYINIGEKKFLNKEKTISDIINRPKNEIIALPLSLYNEKYKNKVRLNKKSKNNIGYLKIESNDIQHSNTTNLFSSVNGGGNGSSVTKENFKEIIINYFSRVIIKNNWIINSDYLYVPTKEINQNIFMDLLIYSLFDNSNHTSSLKNIEYDNDIYNIDNNFFPYLKQDIKNDINNIQVDGIYPYYMNEEERFVAKYIEENMQYMSNEAKELYDAGLLLYKEFYANLHNLNRDFHKIASWDVGWLQVKRSLEEKDLCKEELNNVKQKHNILKDKLKDFNYEHGILNKYTLYEE